MKIPNIEYLVLALAMMASSLNVVAQNADEDAALKKKINDAAKSEKEKLYCVVLSQRKKGN